MAAPGFFEDGIGTVCVSWLAERRGGTGGGKLRGMSVLRYYGDEGDCLGKSRRKI